MNVLIACEVSGIVCNVFTAKGHNAFSCDLKPSTRRHHIQMDANFVIGHANQYCDADRWDLIIAHPPCTALAVCGNRWYGQNMPKHTARIEAIRWTNALWLWARHHADSVCFENPVGVLSKSLMGKPTQYIQPWQFGHGETKRTGLWLSGLPKLTPTDVVSGREQRIWKMSPSPERGALRSITYTGIAQAMADQWG